MIFPLQAWNQYLAAKQLSLAALLADTNQLIQLVSNHIVVSDLCASPPCPCPVNPARPTTKLSCNVSPALSVSNMVLYSQIQRLTMYTMWNPPASAFSNNKPNQLQIGLLNPITIVASSGVGIGNSQATVFTADLRAGTSYVQVITSVLVPKVK